MTANETPSRSNLLGGLRMAGFALIVGFILQLASERAYWFYSPRWFGADLSETIVLSLFYGFAAGGALWALAKVPFRGLHQVVLAGAVMAWTVEGVIVYVLHEAGPFDPFFPAMFAGWHGLISFVGFFYLVRRWLLDRNTQLLAGASLGFGVIWGLWASTSWLPDSDQSLAAAESGDQLRTEPIAFAATAILIAMSLAIAHLVLDRLWPASVAPTRRSTGLVLGLTGLYAAVGFFVIPWGPLRWAALVAIPAAGLRWSVRGTPSPHLFLSLAGTVRGRDTWALAPMAVGAALVYALLWLADPSEAALEALMLLHLVAQMAAGAVAVIWAMRRAHNQPESPKNSARAVAVGAVALDPAGLDRAVP